MLPPNLFLCNRYSLRQRLGQGGMAAVYKAEDYHLPGTFRAVKEMSEAALTSPAERQQAIEGFRQEARELSSLSHPNIVRVVDFFSESGRYFLVMEYVDGANLEDMLAARGSPFPESAVLPWLDQLCDALHYLHRQFPPIIFRDLKPSNIMVDRSGSVKLIDFGIARRFDPHKITDTKALGSEGYAPPEQYGNGQTDTRSDIYALAATAHRLLTGFDPATRPGNLPPVRTVNPAVSQPLARILDRCLQYEPDARLQRVTEVQQALAGVSPSRPATGGVKPRVQPSTRPTTRLVQAAARLNGRQLAMLLGGALLALVLGVWLLGPWLEQNYPALWYEVPAFLIAGPVAYAATRRLGPAFVAQVIVTIAVFVTYWLRSGIWTYEPRGFLLGVLLSAVAFEASFYVMDHQSRIAQSVDNWQREIAWYALTTCLAAVAFYAAWYPVRFTGGGWVWLNCAAIGAAGWFIGDLIRQGTLARIWRKWGPTP